MEPTPIFAALVEPGAHGDDRADGRSVAELLRALRAEREDPDPACADRGDERVPVGCVPGLLTFRLPA
ncbi:hypothetical protein [Actinomycetospora cinnamomea]|uniref:hypothetical protein n=1 Tax=Actinomycetospora cinnamomea TaxID=663609 RepID=UPI0010581D3E|nr:hypothetical protein [Actinomycetospora cinnamomea]